MNDERLPDPAAPSPPGGRSPEPRPRPGPQMIAGAILVGLGLLLLLERMDVVHRVDLGSLWPLIVIGIGLSRLYNGDAERTRQGWFLLLFGLWFLVNTLGLFGLDWGVSWPLALVAVGGAKLLGGAVGGERLAATFLLAAGAVLQAIVLEVFGIGLREAWPLIIVAAGIWIVLQAFGRRPAASAEKENES